MLVFLLSFLILPNHGLAKYSGGSGEPNNPYQISTADDLLTLTADTNDYGKSFVLTADIDLDPNLPGRHVFTTAVIAPDGGNSNEDFDGIAFTGLFDGAGHKIINLTVDANGVGNEYLGFFGFLAAGGKAKNLSLENVSIASGNDSRFLGGIVGWNNGIVSDCFSTGTLTTGVGSIYLGGLAGYNNGGGISNCFATGIVTSGSNPFFLGGLAGLNSYGAINNCYSAVIVTGQKPYVGGLLGYNDGGSINGCYFLAGSGPDNDFGEPLEDEQMRQKSSFLGWDFVGETANGTDDIWRMCIDMVNYPLLWWQFNTADFICPDGVDFADYSIIADAWLTSPADADWNGRCDIAEPTDNVIDVPDLAVFCDNWLEGL